MNIFFFGGGGGGAVLKLQIDLCTIETLSKYFEQQSYPSFECNAFR